MQEARTRQDIDRTLPLTSDYSTDYYLSMYILLFEAFLQTKYF
jgi:hypothetical protein